MAFLSFPPSVCICCSFDSAKSQLENGVFILSTLRFYCCFRFRHKSAGEWRFYPFRHPGWRLLRGAGSMFARQHSQVHLRVPGHDTGHAGRVPAQQVCQFHQLSRGCPPFRGHGRDHLLTAVQHLLNFLTLTILCFHNIRIFCK